jgi:hypothetical protein
VDGVSVGHAGRAVTEVCDGRDATQTAGGTEPPTYATQRHEHFNGNADRNKQLSDRVFILLCVSVSPWLIFNTEAQSCFNRR